MSTKLNKDATELKPASQKGRQRRQKIIAAAKQRLITDGQAGLILREIAADMGITHGNLQYYFKTKEDLLQAIFDEEVREYTYSMREAAKQASSKDGIIGAIFESMMQEIESDQTKLWRVLIGTADQNKVLANILRRENDFFEDALTNEIKTVAPGMSDARSRHVAKIMKCIFDGMSIELTYANPQSAEYMAFKSEVRAIFQSLIKDG